MDQRNVARIEISPELLVKYLHMPEDTEIWDIALERGTYGHVVMVGVYHPDLPLVDESEITPLISPVITYHKESWDFDWNVPVEHALQMDDVE
jgi:hypothetical protein